MVSPDIPDVPGSATPAPESWIGRSETLQDDICAAPLRSLAATLDDDGPAPEVGTPVPPLAHWLYFLPRAPQHELGEDGHPRRGGFLPPIALPRRMWAGGELTWALDNPLRVGDAAERRSRIAAVTPKTGRSGDMVFVQVLHEVHNARGLCLTETHDIVYRDAARPGEAAPAPVMADTGAPWQRTLVADAVLLFRYSALTFNGHRIHYDRAYVTEVEGYPGLVVHGPLIATLLADMLRRHAPQARLQRFRYQALRPSFDGQPFTLNAAPDATERHFRLWASNADGHLTMRAEADAVWSL